MCIAHEKRLKRFKREGKSALIEQANPDWSDQVRGDGGSQGAGSKPRSDDNKSFSPMIHIDRIGINAEMLRIVTKSWLDD